VEPLPLPGTDLAVSPLCLGMADAGVRGTERDAHRLMDRFAAAGGRFLDTARIYSDWVPGETGRSERIIGDWLASRPDRGRFVVATKGGHPPLDDLMSPRLSPALLAADLEASLKALRVPRVDLYILHRDNPRLPVGPILDALEGFTRQGLIGRYGCSNWTAPRIEEAIAHARERGLRGFAVNQVMWNPGTWAMSPPSDPTLVRLDARARELHRRTGMPVMAFSSQAGGFFSKLEAGPDDPRLRGSPYWTEANLRVGAVLRDLARAHGAAVSAVALAYLRCQDITVIPIVGCHTADQLDDSLAGLDVMLVPEELGLIEEAAAGPTPAG
jgi:aryl-alcohol dehydrogenase-like predicted oxidoreductase